MAKRYEKAISDIYRNLQGQNIIILETDKFGNLMYPEEHQKYVDSVIEEVDQLLESQLTLKLGSLRGKIKITEIPDYHFATVELYWKRSEFLKISGFRPYFSLPSFEKKMRKAKSSYLKNPIEDRSAVLTEFYSESKKMGMDCKTMKRMISKLQNHLPGWATIRL